MAKNPKAAALALIELPSTAVEVTFSAGQFANEQGVPDQDFMTYDFDYKFNGFAGENGATVSFARNASLSQIQAAVRTKINAILDITEPGNSLTNANIKLRGAPV